MSVEESPELYEVLDGDTLVKIAARHDCTPSELQKFNKLHSRNIWPGQRLKIPPPPAEPLPPSQPPQRPIDLAGSIAPTVHAPLSRPASLSSPPAPGIAVRTSPSPEELDQDCLQRFLKLRVKHLTTAEGSVTGTLLVTPNCLMFDPDVTHPLVVEFGPDPYGMVAPMEAILSASLFKDIAALTGEEQPKSTASQPQPIPGATPTFSVPEETQPPISPRLQPPPSSPKLRPIPEDELGALEAQPGDASIHRRHDSDSEPYKTEASSDVFEDPPGPLEAAAAAKADSCPTLPTENGQEGVGAVASGVQTAGATVATGVVSGTKTVVAGVETGAKAAASGAQKAADGVVTGAKVAADGVVTGTKVAAAGAKSAANAVANVPANIVNMSSGIFSDESSPDVLKLQESWFAEEVHSEAGLKRQESLARLESLKAKTQARRAEARLSFACATSAEERPDLFKSLDQLLPQQSPTTPTALPYYLCVKLRKRQRSKSGRRADPFSAEAEAAKFGNRRKTQFWFTVERDKAAPLYQFLLQWSPDPTGAGGGDRDGPSDSSMERGFLIIDGGEEEAEPAPADAADLPTVGSFLNKEWEIVTVEEIRRRLSLTLSPGELPIPAGATSSTVLGEPQIRQLLEILPPRAESYPWHRVYCSTENGFSLHTLYRLMTVWARGQELSPTLLVVQDTGGAVFGAIVSQPITPNEHFFGTGDSCLLWHFVEERGGEVGGELRHYRWTGENCFFVKSSKESLAVGSGGGSFGLWLDADLNHGRSRSCLTFDNPPLASSEDFIVATVEAFGFSDAS